MPETPLTRSYFMVLDHVRTNWQNVDPKNHEYPEKQFSTIFKTISDLIRMVATNPGKSGGVLQLKKIFNSLLYIKCSYDKYDWQIDNVPKKALTTYWLDLAFYLKICRYLRNAATIWSSLLPLDILPPSHLTNVKIKKASLQKAKSLCTDITDLEMFEEMEPHKPVESIISSLSALAKKNNNYNRFALLLQTLKSNLKVFSPHNQMDEQLMLSHLNKIKLYLQNSPSPESFFNIITCAIDTGLLITCDTEDSISKLISECTKGKEPLSELNQLSSSLHFRGKINKQKYTSSDLNINVYCSFNYLKKRIKQITKETRCATDTTPKIQWFDSQERFLELFCKLIKDKTILIPNQRDRNTTINLISNIFLVRMIRGDGFYSPVSLAKYIREKIGGYY